MIRGMHAMFYSSQADALRAFVRDKLGLAGTDVGGGWLIFDALEADSSTPDGRQRTRLGNGRHLFLLRRHRPNRARASSTGGGIHPRR